LNSSMAPLSRIARLSPARSGLLQTRVLGIIDSDREHRALSQVGQYFFVNG